MSGNDFMPHGYCFLWQPDVLWLHVLSDLGITLAYLGIPLVLLWFIRQRKDMPFQLVFALFGAFILLCGTTHALSIWVLWHPDYYFEGFVKALTAVVSIATLVMMVRMLPQALNLPSPRQLATANAALARTNAQLEEANAKLAELYVRTEERGRVELGAVVDNVLDGIITIDESGAIESFNIACVSIFGYRPEEVLGRNIKMLMPDPYHAEHDGYLRNYVTTGQAKIIGTSGREAMAQRKDGTVFPIDLSVSAFKVDGVRHFSGIVRDITRHKQAEESRQRLLERLTESNTELERFAYVASHDMQEPLRMVLNFSQIVATDYADKLDDDGKEYLRIVGDSALRMRDMVQDLLDYARLGQEARTFAIVDMEAELRHVLINLDQMIAGSGAEITHDALPQVRGHAVQLMRLMQNLVSNAIKFQPKGRTPIIHIGVSDHEDAWVFSVRDNGAGIEPAFTGQIFEPFRRLHTWEAVSGTGLGLAVSKKITDTHGGRIWVESRPSEGSTFYVSLPKVLPQ